MFRLVNVHLNHALPECISHFTRNLILTLTSIIWQYLLTHTHSHTKREHGT